MEALFLDRVVAESQGFVPFLQNGCLCFVPAQRSFKTKAQGGVGPSTIMRGVNVNQKLRLTQERGWHEACISTKRSTEINSLQGEEIMEFAKPSKRLTVCSMVLAILMALLIFVSAVKAPDLYAQDNRLLPAVRSFGAESHKGTAVVRVGETLHIVLMCNPSAGYEWEIEGLDASMLQLGKVLFRPTSDLLGAPAEQIIPLTALRRGQTALQLRYKRVWERETRLQAAEGLQDFMMNLTVGD